MQTNKSWYRRKGFWGGIVALVATIARHFFGVDFSLADEGAVAELLLQAATLVGAAVSVGGHIAESQRGHPSSDG